MIELLFAMQDRIDFTEWKSRLEREYFEASNLPRKKKKAERKRLNTLYGIACYAETIFTF